jgi:uncharacterized protein YxjI
MRYRMREEMFAIGDDYWIEADGGEPAFKVDCKALSIRNTLVLETPAGDEVFTIQKKLLSIRDTMEIEHEGRTFATVKKAS